MEVANELEISVDKVTKIAKVCHEINRAYCQSLGDHSQVPWEEAPSNIQQSAVHGVMAHLMSPHLTPEESHATWCRFKIKDGWVFGLEKDMEKKTHPCLVAYDELPIQQRTKDYLFKAAVKQALEVMEDNCE